jgi:glycerate 2-kinase
MNLTDLRECARLIWESALGAASPSVCIPKFVQFGDRTLSIAGKHIPVRGRLVIIGAGKAGAKMGQVLEELLGDSITCGLIVTKYGHSLPLKRIRLVEAGHPIPDAAGVSVVQKTRELIEGLTPDDTVLCLLSGGGSALWPGPAEGITLEQKQEVTQLLLRAGATIRELNAVRKHLSAIKGGQLVRWASPARVISLIISDVIGDPLDFIASGPTAPDTTTFSDAFAIIQKYKIRVPKAVEQRLLQGVHGQIADTPKPGDPIFHHVENHIVANNRLIVDAAAGRARSLNFNTLILSTEVEGEAKQVAQFFTAIAREISRSGNPTGSPACILAAGETTVTVRGSGQGGRNQEMALAWAISMASRPSPSCFASVATDGSDGPTYAAGGIVDHLTCDRARGLGLEPLTFLDANDSLNLLKATGDLIVTGPTQTNVMDLQVLLVP